MGKLTGLAGAASGMVLGTEIIDPHPPTPQMSVALEAVLGGPSNIVMEARAGTGKTTFLMALCRRIRQDAVYLAFNKSVQREIEAKLAQEGIGSREIKSATFHSVGFGALNRHFPKTKSNFDKNQIVALKNGVPKGLMYAVTRLVSYAKQSLVGVGDIPMDDDELWLDLIEHFDVMDLVSFNDDDVSREDTEGQLLRLSLRVLQAGIRESGSLIDFDDMLYLPLYLNLRLWQYKWVFVDEAQDTNPARLLMAEKLLRPDGRLVAVGDPYQAIYGFTGASATALSDIRSKFQCNTLPLTVSFRCSKSVIRHAQQWVPDIEAREGAPEGSVTSITMREFSELVPAPGTAVLCRMTKPLVALAFGYLRRHIPCHIEGKDLGQGLITLCRRWKVPRDCGELSARLDQYLEEETARLLAANKKSKIGAVEDRVHTLQFLLGTLPDDAPIIEAIRLIEKLFEDSPPGEPPRRITLSTVHKAKGREWETVYLLGRDALMPWPYAKLDWELEQEENLCYVAVTRAKLHLVEVEMKPRQGGADA